MMATVSDVTMLNSYRGIGVSTMPNDHGNAPSSGQVHESTTIRNVRGTALFEGARAYNGADVGTWENVAFSNSYWSSAPAAYHPPARAVLDAWTRAHGTGLVLGDLEWDQFYRIALSDYAVGIHVVAGQRAQFTGSFLEPDVRRVGTGLLVDVMDDRWGSRLAGGRVEGGDHEQLAGLREDHRDSGLWRSHGHHPPDVGDRAELHPESAPPTGAEAVRRGCAARGRVPAGR